MKSPRNEDLGIFFFSGVLLTLAVINESIVWIIVSVCFLTLAISCIGRRSY